jgi:uncharacterized phage protein (TIGR01671 family)
MTMFKAWDKKNKKWLHDFRIHPDGRVMVAIGSSNGKWEYSLDVIEDIQLVRWSGMTDKNNEMVFEGDVVVTNPFKEDMWVVNFQDGCFVARLVNGRGKFVYLNNVLTSNKDALGYVVGNIFDQPDIVKPKKKDGQ